MKKLAIAITAVAAFTGSAVAADMPVKAQPYAPVVTAYNWTGCYVGAGGGYGMYNQDISAVSSSSGTSVTLGGCGWFGTGQVGWIALPNLLTFVSAGYTQAHFDQIDLSSSTNIPATTYGGWFLGSGYEYDLSFMT